MTDLDELERTATHASYGYVGLSSSGRAEQDKWLEKFRALATPQAILSLISEVREARKMKQENG